MDAKGLKMSTNMILRVVSAFLAIAMAVVAVDYYFDLGWFGQRGKLLLSIITFVGAIYMVVMRRMWRRD